MAFGNKNSTPSFALTLPMKVTKQDEIFLSKKFRIGCMVYNQMPMHLTVFVLGSWTWTKGTCALMQANSLSLPQRFAWNLSPMANEA